MKQRIKPLKVKIEKIKTLLKSARFFSNKNNYKFLTKDKNPKLFKLLNETGFFKLHYSNRRKQIVGFHQVVLFCHRGYKALFFNSKILKGELEVHHLDHNVLNNEPSNLTYTTPENNKAIAVITSICCNTSEQYHNPSVKFDLDKVKLFSTGEDFCSLLIRSIKATSINFGKDLFKELLMALPFKQSRLIYNMSSKYI